MAAYVPTNSNSSAWFEETKATTCWPIERDDIAKDLFRDWIVEEQWTDPQEVARRAFDAADAFMAEMERRNESEASDGK